MNKGVIVKNKPLDIDPRYTESEGVIRAIQQRRDRLEEASRSRCHECQRFLSDKTKIATVREPQVFYCPRCYSNGLEEEKIAMGYYDKSYSTN